MAPFTKFEVSLCADDGDYAVQFGNMDTFVVYPQDLTTNYEECRRFIESAISEKIEREKEKGRTHKNDKAKKARQAKHSR